MAETTVEIQKPLQVQISARDAAVYTRENTRGSSMSGCFRSSVVERAFRKRKVPCSIHGGSTALFASFFSRGLSRPLLPSDKDTEG